ncbi:MAG: hypothetical protein RSA22_10350 [Acinetobacter sp.]
MSNYPSQWNNYDGFVKSHGYSRFDFKVSEGDINRFGARYRVAASFKSLELNDYAAKTKDGYSALCQVLLSWSAFESFLPLIDLNVSHTEDLMMKYSSDSVIREIRRIDVNDKFYKFIYDRVNKRHKKELDSYFNSDPCNPQYLASSIRHIFAHGPLTPNANEVEPESVVNICKILSQFLLNLIDAEFTIVIEKELEAMRDER